MKGGEKGGEEGGGGQVMMRKIETLIRWAGKTVREREITDGSGFICISSLRNAVIFPIFCLEGEIDILLFYPSNLLFLHCSYMIL